MLEQPYEAPKTPEPEPDVLIGESSTPFRKRISRRRRHFQQATKASW